MSSKKYKVAFVVQRYGNEVIGGAELLAKQLAERFVADLGWQVQVLTTTSKDYLTWANEYQEGDISINGVSVKRFNSDRERSPFFGLLNRFSAVFWPILNRNRYLNFLTRGLEWLWLVAQGPVCPNLIRYLKRHGQSFDQVFFFTYLYYPTLWGYRVVSGKGVVITTAHDELAFHFQLVRRMLNTVPHIITLNPEETELVRSKMYGSYEKVVLAGLGIDIPVPLATKQSVDPEKIKNVLYLGRISKGKGVDTLIDWMNENFSDVVLMLAGKVESDLRLPNTSQIDYRGFVSEEEKGRLIDNCDVLINPSSHESLSLIVLEAMARERPVLVNGNCAVLEYYAKQTQTVFAFKNQTEFNEKLNAILSTDWQSKEHLGLLRQSSDWVRQNYSWPAVFNVYKSLLPAALNGAK